VTVEAAARRDPQTLPPVPPVPAPVRAWDEPDGDLDAVLPDSGYGDRDGYDDRYDDRYDGDADEDPADDETVEPGARRRLVVIGLPVLALAVVIALAWWFGANVLSVAGSVDDSGGSTPPAGSSTSAGASSSTGASSSSTPPPGGPTAVVASAEVFDPEGDGEPENDDDVPLTFDGDPSTSWSTLEYRGSAAFGNLKSGVGIVYDLGSDQKLDSATLTTTTPGATVEVRTGNAAGGDLDGFAVAASGTLGATSDLTFAQPVTTRFVLVWVTGLVSGPDGYSADLSEVTFHTAG
jgi:putative peptidoglycan lipid II flippase